MSFIFSVVTIESAIPAKKPFVRYEGGFLDEFDVYDRMKRDPNYAETSLFGDIWNRIRVENYRFFSSEAKERPADGDHFAMMRAYDELAAQCGAKPFMERKEIQNIGYVSSSISRIHDHLYREPKW